MGDLSSFIVTPKAMRPASSKRECFYCQQAVAGYHSVTCVLVEQRVKVRMIVEYEVTVPAHWDQYMIEFHRNEGSWCSDNAIDELREFSEGPHGCLCDIAQFEYIKDVAGSIYLAE